MHSPGPEQGISAQDSHGAGSDDQASVAPTRHSAGDQARAATGARPEPAPAPENPRPAVPADSPAEAQGRRILSTAFVRVGPDGHLTVELRSGHVMVLRNVVLRRTDYCGVRVQGGPAGAQYCGGYAEVAAARPGGGPAPEAPDLEGVPLEGAANPNTRRD